MKLEHYHQETAEYRRRDEKPGSAAKVLDRLSKAAYDNNRAYEGCARCVLHALQSHLSIVEDAKEFAGAMAASTALSAGIGRQGETCGALLGALGYPLLAPYLGASQAVAPATPLLALAGALLVGGVAGLGPARRAAAGDPPSS